MSEISRYRVDENTVVAFEVDPATQGFREVGAVDEVVGAIRDAAGPAVAAAQTVLELVREAKPSEAEITFSIKVNGTMDWLVAKASTEGNFQVRLLWASDAKDTSQQSAE